MGLTEVWIWLVVPILADETVESLSIGTPSYLTYYRMYGCTACISLLVRRDTCPTFCHRCHPRPSFPPQTPRGLHLSLSLALESIVVILVPTITWYMLLRDRFPYYGPYYGTLFLLQDHPRPLIPRRQAPALRIIPVPVQSRWRGPHDLAPRTEYQTYFLG
jgi:hypothetical protein